MRTTLILSALAIGLCLWTKSSASDKEDELTFRQDGDDLVVTTTLTVNNSPHVVLTDFAMISPKDEVHLSCSVVQNRDLLVRSRKEIKVEWRLPRHKKGDRSYRVESWPITPGTGELQQAIPKLQELMRAGQEFKAKQRD